MIDAETMAALHGIAHVTIAVVVLMNMVHIFLLYRSIRELRKDFQELSNAMIKVLKALQEQDDK